MLASFFACRQQNVWPLALFGAMAYLSLLSNTFISMIRYANYHRLSIRYGNDVVEIRDYVAQARDEGNDESPVQGHGASDSMHWSGDDADATLRVARRPRFEIEVVDQQSHSTVLFSSDVLVIATGLTPQYVGGITPRTNDGNKSASSKAHAVPISISRVVANLDVLGEDYSTFNTTLSGFEVHARHEPVPVSTMLRGTTTCFLM